MRGQGWPSYRRVRFRSLKVFKFGSWCDYEQWDSVRRLHGGKGGCALLIFLSVLGKVGE